MSFRKISFLVALMLPVLAAWNVCVAENNARVGRVDLPGGRGIPEYRFHNVPNTSYYGGIHSIAKDRVGRIWFSGHEALCLYDGTSFTRMDENVERIAPFDSWNFGAVKTAGKDTSLFIGSNHGILRFDYDSMSFECLFPGNIGPFDVDADGGVWMVRDGRIEMFNADDAGSGVTSFDLGRPSMEGMISVYCSEDGVYASVRNTLFKLNPEDRVFHRFATAGGDNAEIKDVLKYGDSLYILTLMDGLFRMLPDGTLRRSPASRMISDRSSSTKMLYRDPCGIIWVATQAGLLLLDPETEDVRLLRMDLGRPYSLPNNSVWSIFPDPDGGLWIGTYGGKIAYSALEDSGVDFFNAEPGGLLQPIVSCFGEDSHDNIWIGTEGGGISVLDRKTFSFRYFTQSDGSGLASDFIKRIRRDDAGRMWVSSFNGGVQIYDETSGRFRTVAGASLQYPLSVYDFMEDGDGGLWMSNPDENLKHLSKDGRISMVCFTGEDGELVKTHTEMMFRDEEGNLCLLSHSGLYVADPVAGKIIRCLYIEDSPFSVNNLISFCKTASGDIWIGTAGGGVNVLGRDGEYVNMTDAGGSSLMGRTVFGIVEDDDSGDVWLSTDDGIYVYGKDSGLFVKSRIDSNGGCGSYYVRSYFKTSKGEMLFGGTDGFMIFTPSRIVFNRQKPEVFFTGLIIDNTVVSHEDKGSPLKKSISVYRDADVDAPVKLSHRQANFGIVLSSNSYLDAGRNQYAYRMKGLSDEWMILPDGQKTVSFFNMRPGKYVFEARGANNDGVWGDKVTSLRIEVRPSPFLSAWAYALYISLIFIVIFACWRFFTNKKILEQKLQIEQIKEENMRQMTQARINFFTSISHDLKTPLTLVVDPLKQLKEHLPETSPAMKYVHLIERNVVRIQRMITQLLQFREIESQKLSLNRQPGDLVRFIGNIFSLFENIANSKDIETDFRSEMESFYTLFDYDVMEKIITNLISNAFKYSPRGGFVGLSIARSSGTDVAGLDYADRKEWLSFTVTNIGSEIPEDKREIIFKAFSRLSSQNNTLESSTGLGLAIVKELVDNLGGRISVDSENSRVSFEVCLPFSPDSGGLKEDSDGGYEYAVSEAENLMSETSDAGYGEKAGRKPDSIVVIEDDANLRNYLEMRLSKKYNVYMATNGNDGVAKTVKVNPRLVITDLMMPEADGFEVCRRIRSDIRTSHIPVIVLSGAGNKDDNRVKALECGASIFIDKPVDIDFLLKQTDSLIGSMRKLKEIYSKKYVAEPSNITISSMDEELLKKAMDNIEKNMDNSMYDVDSFISDMACGRTFLYSKIKDITGMSIREFIMDIRLKRAAQLLKDSEYTVNAVAAMTGFVNPKYFSICFRRQFGLSPSEFRKTQVQ